MLQPADFASRSAPITYELRELIAQLKAVDVFVVGWFDPVRGLQVMPIGDRRGCSAGHDGLPGGGRVRGCGADGGQAVARRGQRKRGLRLPG